MFIHVYLFLLNFLNYTRTQNVHIDSLLESELSSNSDESIIISTATPFAKNRTIVRKSYDDDDNYLMLKDNHHAPKEMCACAKIVRVINPYSDLVPFKSFQTANMQCAICLSIAQQIQTTLADYKIGLNNPTVEIAAIRYGIRSFCKRHFSVLLLRDNLQRFEAVSNILKHASNEVEGHWASLLNLTCNKYMDHINVISFYNILLETTSSISSFLCRYGTLPKYN
ncbi:hypothetical protein FQR65_LT12489 [Abscondita terminalis]|nr:hypothetical protein FQR65_LT12489 [Abscondita terminalis]